MRVVNVIFFVCRKVPEKNWYISLVADINTTAKDLPSTVMNLANTADEGNSYNLSKKLEKLQKIKKNTARDWNPSFFLLTFQFFQNKIVIITSVELNLSS